MLNPCVCGKLNSFPDKKSVWEWLGRIGKSHMRPAACAKRIGIWHATSKNKSGYEKLKRLEEELHSMATMRERIIQHMEDEYKRSEGKNYKFSAADIFEEMKRKNPSIVRTTVAAQLSSMRKDGVITQLERVPHAPGGARYFALTKHIDEMTKPEETNPETEKEEDVKVGEEKKITPAVHANPFDKVNSQLGELLTKVNGLANGYSVIAEAMRNNSPVANDNVLALLEEIKTAATSAVTVDGDKLADVINARLQNLRMHDSFIYRVREEMLESVGTIKMPENYSSLTDEEKYKQGLKDGIKLATELGLKV